MRDKGGESSGLFAPLQSKAFLAIWIAAMVSNVGSLIHSVGEKYQMTQLTPSTLLVALIETGSTLPIFALGLAAGAVADIVDRRRWLITTQLFMMAAAGGLSLLTFLNLITPTALVLMAILIGVGSSLSSPAFQAIVPELLPRQALSDGVSLNSVGYNISRAIGPALGGLVVGALGAGWAFLLNAISFLAVVVVLWKWRRPVPVENLPSERFLGAMKVGLRYARHCRPFQMILLRAIAYIWFSGVIFSLLPALAIHRLHLGSKGFGLLMSCIGAGAIFITFFMPSLRSRFKANQLLDLFMLLAVFSQGIIALFSSLICVSLALFCSGMSWLAIFATINTAIQLSVPSWVKARAFGVYQMAWGGAIALASIFWGVVADHLGLPVAFALSAAGLLLAFMFVRRCRISAFDEALDLSPHQGRPHGETGIPLDAGPVLIQTDFCILANHKADFMDAMWEVRQMRLRNGAMHWALFEEPSAETAEEIRFTESYLHSSMGEHLRQHQRSTNADRQVLASAFRWHKEGRPSARHMVTVNQQVPSLLQRLWH